MLCIRHATIYTPGGIVADGTLLVEQQQIQAVVEGSNLEMPDFVQTSDASGLLLVPGFIDLQLNGAFGLDFAAQPESIWEVAGRLPRYGVTAFLPTMISSSDDTVRKAQSILAEGPPAGFVGAVPLGLHLEGPFLNPHKRGAHNPSHLRLPDLGSIDEWSQENHISLITLAPELPGAHTVIQRLSERGVRVSAGHSMASYDESIAGFDAGIRYGTHLFNAMRPLHHRDPGLAGALLGDNRITIGLIADGIHVHPVLVKLVWQVAQARLSLVTDAMAALGMAQGKYHLGDLDVTVTESGARLADGTLAGSILSLDQALRNLIAFANCPLGDALKTVTAVPADLLGLAAIGRITPGSEAHFVLLTPELEVHSAFIGGRRVYSRGGSGGS